MFSEIDTKNLGTVVTCVILKSVDASSPPHPQIIPYYSASALSVFMLVYHFVHHFFHRHQFFNFLNFCQIFLRYFFIVENAATCHFPMILPSQNMPKPSLTMFHFSEYFLSSNRSILPYSHQNLCPFDFCVSSLRENQRREIRAVRKCKNYRKRKNATIE